MERDQDSQPLVMGEIAQERHHKARTFGVQAGHGLASQQHAGPLGQGTGDGDPLALAAGQGVGSAGAEVGEANLGEASFGAGYFFGTPQAQAGAQRPLRDSEPIGTLLRTDRRAASAWCWKISVRTIMGRIVEGQLPS